MTYSEVIGNRECLVSADDDARALLVQPLGRHERGAFDEEAEMIRRLAGVPVTMAAVVIGDWAEELTPWSEPVIARHKTLGDGARATLGYVTATLLPRLQERYGRLPVVIGGYSLGALFALWAARETDAFKAVAAASPSVWITGWGDYAATHPMQANDVYLSLGDQEEHVRNRAFARVGDSIRAEHELLIEQLGSAHCVLEWNAGNHFADNALRTARAFAWCAKRVAHDAVS